MRTAQATLLSSLMLSIGCTALTADTATPTRSRQASDFPAATEGIVVPATTPEWEGEWSMADLLREYGRVTDQTLMWDRDTGSLLQGTRLGLSRELAIPAAQVHTIVETMLVENDYILSLAHRGAPRILSVASLQTTARQGARTKAIYVPVEELAPWADHPAYLVSTVLILDATDVRTLSNSLRTMLTDANTQQIIPVGSSDAVILIGFAPRVVELVTMLERVNEAARSAPAVEHPSREAKEQD